MNNENLIVQHYTSTVNCAHNNPHCILKTIYHSFHPGANLGKNAMLAFRILTSSGKIYLEYVVNKVSYKHFWKGCKTTVKLL